MRLTAGVEQNISRLDIAMQNAVFMREMHSARDFGDQFRRLSDRNRCPLDHFVKLSAFDELHAEIARALLLADFVDRDDARMIEAGGSFGLPAKPSQVHLARKLAEANYL